MAEATTKVSEMGRWPEGAKFHFFYNIVIFNADIVLSYIGYTAGNSALVVAQAADLRTGEQLCDCFEVPPSTHNPGLDRILSGLEGLLSILSQREPGRINGPVQIAHFEWDGASLAEVDADIEKSLQSQNTIETNAPGGES